MDEIIYKKRMQQDVCFREGDRVILKYIGKCPFSGYRPSIEEQSYRDKVGTVHFKLGLAADHIQVVYPNGQCITLKAARFIRAIKNYPKRLIK